MTRNGILFTGLTALVGLAVLCTKHHYTATSTVAAATSSVVPATANNQVPLVVAAPEAEPIAAPAVTEKISKPLDSTSAESKFSERQIRVAKAKQDVAAASRLNNAPKVRRPVFNQITRVKKAMLKKPIAKPRAVVKRVAKAYACDQTARPNLVGSICFDFNSSQLNPASQAKLDKLVPTLLSSDKKLELSGFADAQGKQGYNQTLSLLRANAVAKYLATKGLDNSKVTVTAYGSQAGKQYQKQRRVDLKVNQP